jgi:hypothetical protein
MALYCDNCKCEVRSNKIKSIFLTDIMAYYLHCIVCGSLLTEKKKNK